MKLPRHLLIAANLLLAALVLWWIVRRVQPPAGSSTTGSASNAIGTVTLPNRPDVRQRLARLQANLATQTRRPDVVSAFQELRSFLTTATPEEASAVIRQFLDTGADASTGLGFVLKPNGFLTESPTLRVWLLDYLSEVEPAGAAAYAEQILANFGSPDEWAVALRAYARGRDTPESRAFLEEKARQMALHEPWQTEPSTGFLEAFDVFVHTRDTEFVPQLGTFLQQTNNRALAHAAYLVLDRLTIVEPEPVLEQLIRQPDLMQGREGTRGNYVARADVSSPVQRQLVEEYLLDTSRGVSELQAFAGTFPNANFMVSNNLLTQNPTITGAELTRRDREALKVVSEWLADPRFERLQPHLQVMKRRLDEFVRQAAAGK